MPEIEVQPDFKQIDVVIKCHHCGDDLVVTECKYDNEEGDLIIHVLKCEYC